MNVYFCLTAACHTMQQCDRLLHHRHQDLVISRLLRLIELLDKFRMIRSTMIQSANLDLVGLQHPSLLQLLQGCGRSLTGIHELLTRNLGRLYLFIRF